MMIERNGHVFEADRVDPSVATYDITSRDVWRVGNTVELQATQDEIRRLDYLIGSCEPGDPMLAERFPRIYLMHLINEMGRAGYLLHCSEITWQGKDYADPANLGEHHQRIGETIRKGTYKLFMMPADMLRETCASPVIRNRLDFTAVKDSVEKAFEHSTVRVTGVIPWDWARDAKRMFATPDFGAPAKRAKAVWELMAPIESPVWYRPPDGITFDGNPVEFESGVPIPMSLPDPVPEMA